MQKVALVTGAGTGIGKSAALALLKDGFAVALVGRRKELLEKTAADSGAKDRALVLPADLAQPEEVKKVFSKTKEAWGRLDVDINLTAMFLCSQEAIRIMKAQDPKGGRIINNGSISAHAPRPMSIAYTATKHAVTGITRTTSLDGRTADIACC